MAEDFVHLHLHTEYSLLDGANRIKDLVKYVGKHGMSSVAVTDHGNMFGAYDLQSIALEHGIKPIIGVEAYVAPKSRHDRDSWKTSADGGEANNYHLTLLVETPKGYKNLCHLVSEAFLTGFYYKPRMDWELLEQYHEGLIALSGCLNSEVSRKLLGGDYEGAKKTALKYQALFGKDRYFIEIMDHGIPEQRQILGDLLRISKETGIPPVATNDSHYLTKADADAQDVLLCIGTGKKFTDPKRMKFYNSEFFVKTPDEMKATFRDHSLEAVKNTVGVAEKVTPKVILDTGLKIPTFPLKEPYENSDDYLEALAIEGLETRLKAEAEVKHASGKDHSQKDYDDRLRWELGVIRKMGLSGYFLIVWDFIRYAKENGIPVGPGRGSAAGSLVAWTLAITEVDPLRYDLLFERFLNPDRVSMPDIDVDLCERRRGEVIEYVRNKYGRENVGQIITFNSLKARAAVRDVGRVLDVPLEEINKICTLIPNNPGKPTSLHEAMREVRELADKVHSNPEYGKLIDLAERLEGISRHAGVHAAGVLIAPEPLVEYLPLYRNNNDEITTQYEMKSVDRMGLLKMDFLGLITLTILDDAVKLAEKRVGKRPDLATIPLDDPEVFKLFSEGRTDGVFQFESSGMKDLLRRVQPSVFEDLAALNALYRPGALDAGTVDVYIERRRGKKFEYPLPALEPILKDTYGVLVYQEQVMLASRAVAGYTPGEADKLRKAIGKKDEALLKSEGEKFLEKAVKAGTPRKKAEELWALILPFGRYGFNKSHSVVYALLAYRTAWMKSHFPVEFMAATLTAASSKSDDIAKYVASCRDMKIGILSPDVNNSDLYFSPEGEAIRFGLGAVKGVGEGAVRSVLAARAAEGPFKSLTDFCARVDLRLNNKKVLEALVRAGAFDSLGRTRATYESGIEMAMDSGAAEKSQAASAQNLLFGEDVLADRIDRFPDKREWPAEQRANHEKEAIGFFLTGHPLAQYEEEVHLFGDTTIDGARDRIDQLVKVVGIIGAVKRTQIKKKGQNEGKTMAKLILDDLTGSVTVTVFATLYEKSGNLLTPGEPIVLTGTVRASSQSSASNENAETDTANVQVEVVAREIQPLRGLREQMAREVRLSASLSEIFDDVFVTLKQKLAEAPGSIPVVLELRRPGQFQASLRTAGRFAVRPSPELTRQLVELLGPGAVRLIPEVS